MDTNYKEPRNPRVAGLLVSTVGELATKYGRSGRPTQ